jgi:zinc D-Ala-D-Ala dipeptidase
VRAGPLLALWLAFWPGLSQADDLPRGFVRLSKVAPTIATDIRYARAFNFTWAVVPGYEAGECILRDKVARELKRVEARLNADGYGLILWDCYRPIRAVRHFADWAETGNGPDMGSYFFPDIRREDLTPQGYVARKSSHSTGTAVDLGLIRLSDLQMRPTESLGTRCDAPFDARPPETGLDMGTAFDCFSPRSGDGADIPPEAQANRHRLTQAMAAEGFQGYSAEWWHFRLPLDGAEPADFPVTKAPRKGPRIFINGIMVP